MAGQCAVTDLCRPLSNRDGVKNLAWSWTEPRASARMPKEVLEAKLPYEATLEDSATLDEEAPIDRFVRHLHIRIAWKRRPMPACDLLRRPLQRELRRYGPPQGGVS